MSIRIADTKVGESSTFKDTIVNTYLYPCEYRNVRSSDPDLKIAKFPARLQPGEIGEVELVFSPPLDRRAPLRDAISWDEVIG